MTNSVMSSTDGPLPGSEIVRFSELTVHGIEYVMTNPPIPEGLLLGTQISVDALRGLQQSGYRLYWRRTGGQ